MRVLITCNFWREGEGNSCLQQTVPLATALRDRGHDVRYAMAPPLHSEVNRQGFPAFSAGDRREFVNIQQQLGVQNLTESERSLSYFENIIAGTFAAGMARDVLKLSSSWRPDLIIREDTEFGGYLAAERLSIPHVEAKVTGMRPPRGRNSLALAERRRELGLAPDPAGRRLDAFLTILPMPLRLFPAAPPNTVAMRPLMFEGDEPSSPPSRRGKRTVVYATSGNTFSRRPEVLRALVAALASEPIDVVATIGRGADRSLLGPLPQNVTVFEWLPAYGILPNVDMVACHAGPATILGALWYGKPLLLAPFAFDHPWNAEACRNAGVAEVVSQGWHSNEIREKARRLLEHEEYSILARTVKAEMETLPDSQQIAAELERIVGQDHS